MAKITTPETYDHEGWAHVLGLAESKKIGHHTYLERTPWNGVAVRLHATHVVTFDQDGTITLNTGGWFTTTTKDRINAVLPQRYRVSSHKGTWHLFDHNRIAGTFASNRLTIPAEA